MARNPAINPLLTTLSENFVSGLNDQFISDAVMGKSIPVVSDSGRWKQYGFSQTRAPETLHSSDDDTDGIKHNSSQLTYSLEDHRIKTAYTAGDVRNNAEGESGERRDRTELVTFAWSIAREVRTSSLLATATQTAAATGAFGAGGSNPKEDFRNAANEVRQNSGFLPNHGVMSWDAYGRLVTDANWIDYVKGNVNSGQMNKTVVEQAIATIVGVSSFMLNVGTVSYNAAPEDITPTITATDAWAASDVFLYAQGPTKNSASFLRCFENLNEKGIRSWKDTDLAKDATNIACKRVLDDQIANQECGFKITGA